MNSKHRQRRPMEDEEALRPARRRPKRKSVPALIVQDLVLLAAILLVFAFFHHVLPRMTAKSQVMPEPVSLATPAPTPEPTPEAEESAVPEETPAPTPEPTPDPMDWRAKFAGHFTEEVVMTDHSYTSPNVSISIEKLVLDDPAQNAVFVADIYIADLSCFQTRWAMDRLVYYGEEGIESMSQKAGAILAINGDYADAQKFGFLVRNGELYYDEQTTNDICVLFYDGTIETYGPGDYLVADILARQPYQVWKFGPQLLDSEGLPRTEFNTTGPIRDVNPRTGLGYYEPGHYCFVVVDGRQRGYSAGMRIDRFAQVFADLGCKAAYNLDGGQSSVMTFQHTMFNHPYLGGRASGDILLICELDALKEG